MLMLKIENERMDLRSRAELESLNELLEENINCFEPSFSLKTRSAGGDLMENIFKLSKL